MKLDAEVPYGHNEHVFKVTSDKNKNTYDIIQLDDRSGKIESDAMLDTIKGNISQSIDPYESCDVSNVFLLSGNCGPTNNCKNATSEISLITQDLLYMNKTVTDAKLPHLSVCANASPNIKGICIDEGVQMIEKILLEYNKVDQAIFSSLNLLRENDNNAIMEGTRENKRFEAFEHSSTNKEPTSLRKLLASEIEEETVKNSLEYILVTEHKAKQFYSCSSIIEKPFDTVDRTLCTPCSGESIDQTTHILEECNTDFSQIDLSCQNDGKADIQNLRMKLDQVEEEKEEEYSTIVSSLLPGEAKEIKKIARIVSNNDDIFDEMKSSVSLVTSNDTKSVRIDHINVDSDDFKVTDVISIYNLNVGETFRNGNENKVINNQQSTMPQNGAETEDLISTSTQGSFLYPIHEELNMHEPILSSSIATGLIPYSGSLSLRSESSTASAQSFAFPILQHEWSSSPVRMAKADRRHSRKQRWKAALTCCKF